MLIFVGIYKFIVDVGDFANSKMHYFQDFNYMTCYIFAADYYNIKTSKN